MHRNCVLISELAKSICAESIQTPTKGFHFHHSLQLQSTAGEQFHSLNKSDLPSYRNWSGSNCTQATSEIHKLAACLHCHYGRMRSETSNRSRFPNPSTDVAIVLYSPVFQLFFSYHTFVSLLHMLPHPPVLNWPHPLVILRA